MAIRLYALNVHDKTFDVAAMMRGGTDDKVLMA